MTAVRKAPAPGPPLDHSPSTARILAGAAVVLGSPVDDEGPRGTGLRTLMAMADRLRAERSSELAWLLLAVLAGAYPSSADVLAVRRAATLGTTVELTAALLSRSLRIAARHGSGDARIRIVGGVVADVDTCAKSEFHNGIQRVTRETMRRWEAHHDLTLAAWADGAGALRDLVGIEYLRAAHWGAHEQPGAAADMAPTKTAAVLIPWRATLVLPEVPLEDRCGVLAALAEHSGNSVVAIGYDAIPVVSADLRPRGEPGAFTAYLSVIKHSDRVAGISNSATAEFAGFAKALASQGLRPPTVHEVMLPADIPFARDVATTVADGSAARPREPVQVMCVGRLEPHKNHSAILHAAERLWQEGVPFELTLVGAPGWSTEAVDRQLADLARRRRPLHRSGAIPDAEMWGLLRKADLSVFVSLHEGFGLPVAESLAAGVPVLTTAYGSQAEIAQMGGCLTVDPRDDDALVDTMRRLITDHTLRDRLRRETHDRPVRTWDDYAHELWRFLVDGAAA